MLVIRPVTDSLSTAAVVDREIVGRPGDEDTPETKEERVVGVVPFFNFLTNHIFLHNLLLRT